MSRLGATLLAVAPVVTAMAAACAKPPPPDVPGSSLTSGGPGEEGGVAFAFDSLDARPVTSTALKGKPSVLAFVTTWDLSSQAQMNYLVTMSAHDGPRVGYAMVALQEAKDREIVEVYRASLKVTFPVALADPATIAGGGPFGDVHAVPTVVVLDRAGRVAWKHVGLATSDEIRGALKKL